MNLKSYTIINYIFTGIILAIFFYSASISPKGNVYPIPCVHVALLGGPCPTCGLSRGFSAIMHFDFKLAQRMQPNTLSVFLFFFIQLLLRFVFIISSNRNFFPLKTISNIDIIVSTLMFFYFFRHLIAQTLYLLYKMMLSGTVD